MRSLLVISFKAKKSALLDQLKVPKDQHDTLNDTFGG